MLSVALGLSSRGKRRVCSPLSLLERIYEHLALRVRIAIVHYGFHTG